MCHNLMPSSDQCLTEVDEQFLISSNETVAGRVESTDHKLVYSIFADGEFVEADERKRQYPMLLQGTSTIKEQGSPTRRR